jgi:predicted N-acetyltransferase YhbS
MELQLKTNYWNDHEASAAFKEFILKIHGLDFTKWESCGYWDQAYTPFSYFAGETVVASVCVYLLDAVLDGRNTRIAQISGVGTLPEWRRKGLNRELTDIGLTWAEGKHEGVFLFSTTDAIPYYERCGFSRINEYVETTQVEPVSNRDGAVKLDPDCKQELDRIYRYATQRVPVSDRFSVLNAKLVMFHVLYGLGDCVLELPDLECLVLYKREDDVLTIYDIVGERIPRFDDFYPYLADPNDRVIEFHFGTDKLGLKSSGTRLLVGNNPFVLGAFPIETPVFPFTSRA